MQYKFSELLSWLIGFSFQPQKYKKMQKARKNKGDKYCLEAKTTALRRKMHTNCLYLILIRSTHNVKSVSHW